MPALSPKHFIISDTLCLSFKFVNSNTRSWFLNNLSKPLCERLYINVGGEVVYDNTGRASSKSIMMFGRPRKKEKT